MTMTRKKIAFVGNSALTMMNFRLGVMKALSKEFDVIMITPKDCDLTPLDGTTIRFVPVEVDCKGLNPFKDLKLLRSLKEIYAAEKLDFVFHYTIKPIIYGSIAATSLGIKHIDVVTGLGYTFIKRNWLFRLSCMLHKLALRKTDAVWFLNQDDCDTFVKLKLVSQSKVRVIHGEGVDTTYFAAKKDPKKEFIFMYFGRMLRSKGVMLFIHAANQLKKDYPDVRWQLLGQLDALNPDAITPEEIEVWVRRGVVEYLGVSKDVRPHLEKVSCIVLPSYYMEGVPRSLMEAASMERAIIATDSVGCKDVVLDGINGLLCEKRSLDDLIATMKKMLELPREELTKMGKRGRELMLRKFDEQIIIRTYRRALRTYLA